jgi:hypothetical protein
VHDDNLKDSFAIAIKNSRMCALMAVLSLWGAFLAGCVSAPKVKILPGDSAAPSQVTPAESMAIAHRYTHHPWRPYARNVRHGEDANGIRVDTPDINYRPESGRNGWWIPGEVNVGIPYKWGGYDDIEEFDRTMVEGHSAGDVSSPAKRMADNAAVSKYASGVDCSGFVSKCLKLPSHHDSAMLPSVCDQLTSFQDLRPGDLLNIPKKHVVLVAGWSRKDRSWLLYYETGGIPDWKPALKEAPLQALMELGYTPLRYRGMSREEIPSGKEVLTRSARSAVVRISNPVIGEP